MYNTLKTIESIRTGIPNMQAKMSEENQLNTSIKR